MAASGSPAFDQQFFDASGDAPVVAAGYLLHQFVSGTVTPQATYTNAAGTIANQNPLTLDTAGRCTLFLGAGLVYTFVLKTPGGATVKTWDGVRAIPTPSATDFLPLAGGKMTGAIQLKGNASAALHAVPLQQVNSLIATSAASIIGTIPGPATPAAPVPIGSISLWLTGSPPVGYLELNGAAVSRTTYADLFALWGTTFGTGDGSTTFGLPDVRGEFPRFWDNTRGVDAGRTIGSAQGDLLKTHTHGVTVNGVSAGVNTGSNGSTIAMGMQASFPDEGMPQSNSDNTAASPSGSGAENRPRNFSMMAIVRAL